MEENIFNRQKLTRALETFKEYSKEKRFEEDTKERRDRKVFFQSIFKHNIDEITFSELIKKLWASGLWGNKEYLVNKIIHDNGMDKLKQELSRLVSKEGSLGDRYEGYLKRIKGMGPSMVTELLCYLQPDEAGIWNDKARKALGWLETKGVPFDTYKINGEEYNLFNNVQKRLADVLAKEGYGEVDLLFVDYFLWEVWNNFAKHEKYQESKIVLKTVTTSKHDEIRDKIAQIGSWLGFEVETEKMIAVGARIDIIWKARIANLGVVSYVFEVQDKGSIDSLIVNLQRAQKNHVVQKLIIVSDNQQIAKIEKEVETMPENFRKALAFWDITDVENTSQSLEQVTSSISRLHLVED